MAGKSETENRRDVAAAKRQLITEMLRADPRITTLKLKAACQRRFGSAIANETLTALRVEITGITRRPRRDKNQPKTSKSRTPVALAPVRSAREMQSLIDPEVLAAMQGPTPPPELLDACRKIAELMRREKLERVSLTRQGRLRISRVEYQDIQI
jgi:hypothetical protein